MGRYQWVDCEERKDKELVDSVTGKIVLRGDRHDRCYAVYWPSNKKAEEFVGYLEGLHEVGILADITKHAFKGCVVLNSNGERIERKFSAAPILLSYAKAMAPTAENFMRIDVPASSYFWDRTGVNPFRPDGLCGVVNRDEMINPENTITLIKGTIIEQLDETELRNILSEL